MLRVQNHSETNFEPSVEVLKICFHSDFRKFYPEAYKKYFIFKYTKKYKEASYCLHNTLKQAFFKKKNVVSSRRNQEQGMQDEIFVA